MTQNTPEYRFLQEIAEDLSSGDPSFPTFPDTTLRVRLALNSPRSTGTLARLVMSEPLLAAKVIRLANSPALNPAGEAITEVPTAVQRAGFSAIRGLAIGIAMDQLLAARTLEPFLPQAQALWAHSLEVSSLSFALARRCTRLDPQEALFAGLVHDIGQFYLLSRAAARPELACDAAELGRLMFQWHDSVGHALLTALSVPDEITRAVAEHEIRFDADEPQSLGQVLYLANQLAERRNPFFREDEASGMRPVSEAAVCMDPQRLAAIVADARAQMDGVLAALG